MKPKKQVKLAPGQVLDLLVAREIFGAKLTTEREVVSAIKECTKRNVNWKIVRPFDRFWARANTNSPYGFYYWKNESGKVEWALEVQRYSRDIDAAMLVAQFMRKDGFNFKMYQHGSYMQCGAPDDHAIVSLVCSMGPCKRHGNKKHSHHGAYDIEGDTAPLAICKAALIAKG